MALSTQAKTSSSEVGPNLKPWIDLAEFQDLFPLYIARCNKFSQKQYSENSAEAMNPDDGSVHLSLLKPELFWSIKNPSVGLQAYLNINLPGWKLYTCSSGTFALSPKAATVIKPEGFGQGVVLVIRFSDDLDNEYYLVIADNKIYVQSCQGGLEEGESFHKGAKREALEELALDLTGIELVEIAYYDFIGGNDLVNCAWPCVTKVFFAHLSWLKVKHLFPNGVLPDGVTIVPVSQYEFKLDEVTEVIAVPENMSCVPEFFSEIKKNKFFEGKNVEVDLEFPKTGHHRQFLELFNTEIQITKPSFLDNIVFDKRLPAALSEFKEKNPELFYNLIL